VKDSQLEDTTGLCFIEPRDAIEVLSSWVKPSKVQEILHGLSPESVPEELPFHVADELLTAYIFDPLPVFSMDTGQ
jgi:hypothetical protein